MQVQRQRLKRTGCKKVFQSGAKIILLLTVQKEMIQFLVGRRNPGVPEENMKNMENQNLKERKKEREQNNLVQPH